MENFNCYNNNFIRSIPKKQAKSYEIDLGQNNGAYDEELLIRYGDNTLNQMKSKNKAKNLNMDDILKMNEQLKPFQEKRINVEGITSYKEMCDNIEINMNQIEKDSKFLDDFEKTLNKSIEVMTNDIFKFFDDTYNQFNPELLEKYNYLKSKIKEQKDENANLLKQIDFLLQENTQIMDMVYKVGSRLEKLENKAGIDKVQELPKAYKSDKSGSESENFSEENESSNSEIKPDAVDNNQLPGDQDGQNNEQQNEEGENEEGKKIIDNNEENEDGNNAHNENEEHDKNGMEDHEGEVNHIKEEPENPEENGDIANNNENNNENN